MKYHYTHGISMLSILRDGYIKPAKTFLPKGERPVVWFSTNPDHERTAAGAFMVQFGVFRIGVDDNIAPHPWKRIQFLANMHPAIADRLASYGRQLGANPDEWFGTFHPVPKEKWLVVQERVDGRWIDGDLGTLPNVLAARTSHIRITETAQGALLVHEASDQDEHSPNPPA